MTGDVLRQGMSYDGGCVTTGDVLRHGMCYDR